MQEAHAALASGNTVRITGYSLEVRAADGTVLRTIDLADVRAAGRTGQTITVVDQQFQQTSLDAATLDDAGTIETALRSAFRARGQDVSAFVPPPPVVDGQSRKDWKKVALVVGLLGIACVAYLGFLASSESSSSSSSSNRRTVIYRVTDSDRGTVDLTYENAGGNTQQESEARTPWEESQRMRPRDFVYVSAQRISGSPSGTVTCEIVVDGDVIERAESTGEFVIASCSGSVPR